MHALTVWQPWASLIACGAKQIETRSWPAPEALWGERIAIHAAKRQWSLDDLPEGLTSCSFTGFAVAYLVDTLPRGMIIGTARLAFCAQVEAVVNGTSLARTSPTSLAYINDDGLGDYRAGRWLWFFEDIVQLGSDQVIECSGRQRLWQVPAEHLPALEVTDPTEAT